MKILTITITIILLTFSLDASAESTGYFGALWDFIDWIYDALENIKQTILDFLAELSKVIILYYLEYKLEVIKLAWSIAEPLIASLNLTDLITTMFGSLSPDVQMLLTELRIGEAINLLLSAYTTRIILKFTGF